jgi:hypothetical protein
MPDVPTGEAAEVTTGYPTAMLIAREMQKIAPSDRKMKGNTNVEQRLKQRLIGQMQRIGEERRHVDMGVIADTQQWVQVNAGIRENVDRVVMFKLKSAVAAGVFKTLTGEHNDRYASRVSGFDRGKAAVLGAQWLSTGRDFEMPIEWIPPLCHHLDAENDEEPDGWRARARFKDGEELRASPYSIADDPILGESSDQPNDPSEETPDGFEDFVDLFHVTDDYNDTLVKGEVYDAYCDFAEEHDMDQTSPQWFGRYFRKWVPESEVPGDQIGKHDIYRCLQWRDAAEPYLEDAD